MTNGEPKQLPIYPPSNGTTTRLKTIQMNVTGPQRIGIVTCCAEKLADYFPTTAEPEFVPVEVPFTPDDQLLVDELRRLGHHVSAVIWGADTSELTSLYDRLIVRSPWDYMDSDEQRRNFLSWLEKLAGTGLPIENDLQVMLWLMDKRYLIDLEAVGVPIVPTRLVSVGEVFDLEAFAKNHSGIIVKPAVSAAGAGLEFLPDLPTAHSFQENFVQRCQSGAQLVQPFLPEIQTNGEWSLIYFRGEFSHAVHKCPALGQILVHAERGGSLRFAEPPVRRSNRRRRSTGIRRAPWRGVPHASLPAHRCDRNQLRRACLRVRGSRTGTFLPRASRQRRSFCRTHRTGNTQASSLSISSKGTPCRNNDNPLIRQLTENKNQDILRLQGSAGGADEDKLVSCMMQRLHPTKAESAIMINTANVTIFAGIPANSLEISAHTSSHKIA